MSVVLEFDDGADKTMSRNREIQSSALTMTKTVVEEFRKLERKKTKVLETTWKNRSGVPLWSSIFFQLLSTPAPSS